jgi:hypothetical protein
VPSGSWEVLARQAITGEYCWPNVSSPVWGYIWEYGLSSNNGKLLVANDLPSGRSTPAASTNRPQRSTGVHGIPWAPSRSASKRPPTPPASRARRCSPRPPPAPIDECVGVFLGVRSDLGGSIPWGYWRPSYEASGLLTIQATKTGALCVELARTCTPYKRAAAVDLRRRSGAVPRHRRRRTCSD